MHSWLVWVKLLNDNLLLYCNIVERSFTQPILHERFGFSAAAICFPIIVIAFFMIFSRAWTPKAAPRWHAFVRHIRISHFDNIGEFASISSVVARQQPANLFICQESWVLHSVNLVIFYGKFAAMWLMLSTFYSGLLFVRRWKRENKEKFWNFNKFICEICMKKNMLKDPTAESEREI